MIAVMPFMRECLSCSLAPENLAGAPIKTENIKTVNDLRLRVRHGGQGRAALNLNARLGNGFRAGLLAGGLGQ